MKAPSIHEALDMKRPAAWRLLVGRAWPMADVEAWRAREGLLDSWAAHWGAFMDNEHKVMEMMRVHGRIFNRLDAELRTRQAYYVPARRR